MMTDDEIKALKATMPWREHLTQTKKGGLVQIVDINNQEVPLFVMTKFLTAITAKLASKKENADGQTSDTSANN